MRVSTNEWDDENDGYDVDERDYETDDEHNSLN